MLFTFAIEDLLDLYVTALLLASFGSTVDLIVIDFPRDTEIVLFALIVKPSEVVAVILAGACFTVMLRVSFLLGFALEDTVIFALPAFLNVITPLLFTETTVGLLLL